MTSPWFRTLTANAAAKYQLFCLPHAGGNAAHFTPDTYVGDIRFLLPNQGSGFAPGMDDNTLNFWREVCLGELQVTTISGNHFSCIETPNVQAVARLVNEGLQ